MRLIKLVYANICVHREWVDTHKLARSLLNATWKRHWKHKLRQMRMTRYPSILLYTESCSLFLLKIIYNKNLKTCSNIKFANILTFSFYLSSLKLMFWIHTIVWNIRMRTNKNNSSSNSLVLASHKKFSKCFTFSCCTGYLRVRIKIIWL